MKIIKDETKSIKLKEEAITALNNLLDSYIEKREANCEKLSYWIKDFCTYLSMEKEFQPTKLRRYKRGEIIKANLGYNVGSEEGGLHYCVVIDKNNPLSSPVLTIIPLTSLKDNKDINHLKQGELYIGKEVYEKVAQKLFKSKLELSETLSEMQNYVYESTVENPADLDAQEYQILNKKYNKIIQKVSKLDRELKKMKLGGIALVNQICTISKLRIYNPKSSNDILAGIKLSSQTLDKIDATVKDLFIN